MVHFVVIIALYFSFGAARADSVVSSDFACSIGANGKQYTMTFAPAKVNGILSISNGKSKLPIGKAIDSTTQRRDVAAESEAFQEILKLFAIGRGADFNSGEITSATGYVFPLADGKPVVLVIAFAGDKAVDSALLPADGRAQFCAPAAFK